MFVEERFIHPLQQKIYVKWKPHSIYDKLCEEDGLFVVKKTLYYICEGLIILTDHSFPFLTIIILLVFFRQS